MNRETQSKRQKECINKWIKAGCRGTCVCVTGFGKTRVGLIGILAVRKANPNCSILIVVPSTHLEEQWKKAIVKYDLKNVSIEILNSACKRSSKYDLLVIDEVHHTASEEFIGVYKRANGYILGLTATFDRLDGREKFLNTFCPVVDTVDIIEALDNDWLSKYREFELLVSVEDIGDYLQLCDEFQEAFDYFGMDFKFAMSTIGNKDRRMQIAKAMNVNYGKLTSMSVKFQKTMNARKKFIMQHPMKIKIANHIIESLRNDKKIITFSSTVDQSKEVNADYYVNSKRTKKANSNSIEEFCKVKTGVMSSVKALNEGVDIPGLNTAIIISCNSSKINKIQQLGRVIRIEDNKTVNVFTIVIKDTIEEKWYENSTTDRPYIKINLRELEKILNNEKIDKNVRYGESVSQEFRV